MSDFWYGVIAGMPLFLFLGMFIGSYLCLPKIHIKNKIQKTFLNTFAEAALSHNKESLCDFTYQRALVNIKIRKNIDFNALAKEVKEKNHVSS